MSKIWTNVDLTPETSDLLKHGCAGHELVVSNQKVTLLGSLGESESLQGFDVVLGQPDPKQLLENEALRFVQVTSAGYTRYDTVDFRNAMKGRGVALCNSSAVFAEPCSQHILAFMLSWARQIPAAVRCQIMSQDWSFDTLRAGSKILQGDTVVIVGYGAIGKRLAELLAPFVLTVVGIRRTVRGDEPIACYPETELASWLGRADHVVNILPANDANNQLFDRIRFDQVKPGAVFYNIGRGTTVDQPALIEALDSGHISAALLDVTDPEPLPAEHPLWKAPNCVITPHTAGGYRGEEVVTINHFLANFQRYLAGEPMQDRVF